MNICCKGTALSYDGVLEYIGSCLDARDGYSARATSIDGVLLDGHYDDASKYNHKAAALIELLEIHNCGSVGGFDVAQNSLGQNRTLRQRYEWLKEHRRDK